MRQTRTRTTGERCPQCGAPGIYVVQQDFAPAESPESYWKQQSGHKCPSGCRLTIADFPQGCTHDE